MYLGGIHLLYASEIMAKPCLCAHRVSLIKIKVDLRGSHDHLSDSLLSFSAVTYFRKAQ